MLRRNGVTYKADSHDEALEAARNIISKYNYDVDVIEDNVIVYYDSYLSNMENEMIISKAISEEWYIWNIKY